jgi:hypothetical protein
MQPQPALRNVPLDIRCLLAAGGVLLPPALRAEWLREWHAEVWHCPGSGPDLRQRLRMRALGAFPDAWALLRQNYGIARRIGDIPYSRFAPILLMILLIAAAALATGGFRRGRHLLFHDDSQGLVLVVQPLLFMGGSARIPAAQADAWSQASKTAAESGRWSIEESVRGVRHVRVCRADATAQALLSKAPVKPQCDFVEPAGLAADSFAGVVARLKSGASLQDAELELQQTAGLHKGWLTPSIVSLAEIRKAPLVPVGSAVFGFLLLSALAVRALTIRATLWAVSKIALTYALIAGVWIELAARAPFTQTAGIPGSWNAPVYFLPVVAGGGAAWWFRRDAQRRCRICHRALAMPVFVGLSGSCLLEPGGTEYLCAEGHGALLAGSIAGQMAAEVWATWSDTPA